MTWAVSPRNNSPTFRAAKIIATSWIPTRRENRSMHQRAFSALKLGRVQSLVRRSNSYKSGVCVSRRVATMGVKVGGVEWKAQSPTGAWISRSMDRASTRPSRPAGKRRTCFKLIGKRADLITKAKRTEALNVPLKGTLVKIICGSLSVRKVKYTFEK